MRKSKLHKALRAFGVMVRPLFNLVVIPLMQLLVFLLDFLVEREDPWNYLQLIDERHQTPWIGSAEEFRNYLSRKSHVAVCSVEGICHWLLGCEYVRSAKKSKQENYWQNPQDFEKTKRGDCKDFALWTWRKLIDLGIQADFYVGIAGTKQDHGPHAWVVYVHKDRSYVFEGAMKDRDYMIMPLSDVRSYYVPWFSIDHKLQRYAYWGFIYTYCDIHDKANN